MTKENNKKALNRNIMLNENVTEVSIGKIVEKILEIITHDEEHKNDVGYKVEPIKLFINSYGGNLYDANLLIGIIETSPTPIYTYCYGKAMSAGLYIFASGHKRFASPLATFMYHDASVGIHDSISGLKYTLESYTKLRDRYDEYIASKTNLPKHIMDEKKKVKEDWYLTGEEAVGYGLADELVSFRN